MRPSLRRHKASGTRSGRTEPWPVHTRVRDSGAGDSSPDQINTSPVAAGTKTQSVASIVAVEDDSFQLEDHLDFDGDVAGQRAHSHRAAGAYAVLFAEDVGE